MPKKGFNHISTMSQKEETIEKLGKLLGRPQNWDGRGANKVSAGSVEGAIDIVYRLSVEGLVRWPEVYATPSGNAALKWEWPNDGKELVVVVYEDGSFGYAFVDEPESSFRNTAPINFILASHGLMG